MDLPVSNSRNKFETALNVTHLLQIFSYIAEPRELGSLARVCVKWNIVANLDALWLRALHSEPLKEQTSFYAALDHCLPKLLHNNVSSEETSSVDPFLSPRSAIAQASSKRLAAESWHRTSDICLRLPHEPTESFALLEGTCKLEYLLRHRALLGRTVTDAGDRVTSPGANRLFQAVVATHTKTDVEALQTQYYGGGHDLSGSDMSKVDWVRLGDVRQFACKYEGVPVRSRPTTAALQAIPPRYTSHKTNKAPLPPPRHQSMTRESSAFNLSGRNPMLPRVLLLVHESAAAQQIINTLRGRFTCREWRVRYTQGIVQTEVECVIPPEMRQNNAPSLLSPPLTTQYRSQITISATSLNSIQGNFHLTVMPVREYCRFHAALLKPEWDTVQNVALYLPCSRLYPECDDLDAIMARYMSVLHELGFDGSVPLLGLAAEQDLVMGNAALASLSQGKPPKQIPTLSPILTSYMLRYHLKALRSNMPDHYTFGNMAWCVQGCALPQHEPAWGVFEGLAWALAMGTALRLQNDGIVPKHLTFGNLLDLPDSSPKVSGVAGAAMPDIAAAGAFTPYTSFEEMHYALRPPDTEGVNAIKAYS